MYVERRWGLLTLFIFHFFDISPSYRNEWLWVAALAYWEGNKPANAFSEPVSTIAPTESSLSASSSAWFNSLNNGLLSAFNDLGLLSVTSSTEGSGRETKMYSYCDDDEDMDRMREQLRSRLLRDGEYRKELWMRERSKYWAIIGQVWNPTGDSSIDQYSVFTTSTIHSKETEER